MHLIGSSSVFLPKISFGKAIEEVIMRADFGDENILESLFA